MALSAEDMDEVRDIVKTTPLQKLHFEQIEGKFVKKEDCARTTVEINRKLLQDYTDLAVIKFQNKLILGVLGVIGTTIIGYVISQMWG